MSKPNAQIYSLCSQVNEPTIGVQDQFKLWVKRLELLHPAEKPLIGKGRGNGEGNGVRRCALAQAFNRTTHQIESRL
jgi:hypothetical protein